MLKKHLSFLLGACFCLSLVGCGGEGAGLGVLPVHGCGDQDGGGVGSHFPLGERRVLGAVLAGRQVCGGQLERHHKHALGGDWRTVPLLCAGTGGFPD